MIKKLKKFYKNKKIIITGHTGFVGTWLIYFLNELEAKVYGISLKDNNKSFKAMKISKKMCKTFYADINNLPKIKKIFKKIKPNICFHLAAQPLVIDSYLNPIKTLRTNVIGTSNILECINQFNIKNNLIITTDKCYKNDDKKKYFIENDKLGGKDIYSSSKACAELITYSYYYSFLKKKNIKVHTVRAGNIIGGGDFGKYRLLPTIFSSINKKSKLVIRSPNSIRPWQNILDLIYAYIFLIYHQNLKKENYNCWNVGPNKKQSNYKVKFILKILEKINNKKIKFKNKPGKYKESKVLMLNNKKISKIGWKNNINIQKSLHLTNEWYKRYYTKKNIFKFNKNIIKSYLNNT